MSGTKKAGDNSENESSEIARNKSETEKKYPFQTTRRNNSAKIKSENTDNLLEKLSGTKIETDQAEVLTQVSNEATKLDINSPETVSEVRDRDSEDRKPPLEQTTRNLGENKIELDPIEVSEQKEGRGKIRRADLTEKEIDEICEDRDTRRGKTYVKKRLPGLDPRFQQENQTLRCYVMYTDFYRCENILGKGEPACQWFKDVFTSICPLDWIRRWDEDREEGRFGWPKGRSQGKFPGNRYGV